MPRQSCRALRLSIVSNKKIMRIFNFTAYLTNELSARALCMLIKPCCVLLSILLFTSCSDEQILPNQHDTLTKVKSRGELLCGVHNTNLQGFSYKDKSDQWSGMDVDICRAVAAAVLGDASKVQYIPIPSYGRFRAVQLGQVDILSRNLTWTLSRDTLFGIDFTAIVNYDGQGFMVRKAANIKSIKDLHGKKICVLSGTTSALNVARYFTVHKLRYIPVVFKKISKQIAAYASGKCDAYTDDKTILATIQHGNLRNPNTHIILPQLISKEPISPVVIQGDSQWRDIVRWSIFAMLNAEEHNITSTNVENAKKKWQDNPVVMRLLGYTDNIGTTLGLQPDWAYQIIKQVGNYSEMYEQNLGSLSTLKINRGINKLWMHGGIMYAPPML
jgi:general L-amino acid transport system substrate-binding protein